MYSDYTYQRENYKLVEKLISGSFDSPINLLKSLVKDIVDHDDFSITGGRIWELLPDERSYKLSFQYGYLDKIPDDYKIKISDQPVLKDLIHQRTILNNETDELLQEKGINLYSVIGVGEIISVKSGKFYKYVVGFNAPEILQSFNELLNIISSVTTVALRNLKARKETEKIRKDLTSASEIQRNLLPEHHIRFHDYDVFGVCVPDSEIGGDYFDYIMRDSLEGDSLGIIISDAASKGLPAAVQALFVSGAMRMGLRYATRMSDIFAKLNTLIFDTFVYERFVTLFYCELTLSQNRLVLYVNAGHCAPIHYRADTDKIDTLLPTGGLLGIMKQQKFGLENIHMHSGDILLLYTDGITEAQNDKSEFYGEERVINMIRKYKDSQPQEIAYAVLEDVQKFCAETSYSDDRTLVVIKRD